MKLLYPPYKPETLSLDEVVDRMASSDDGPPEGTPGLTRPQQGAIAKIDNIIANGAKEHDFAGVAAELAGTFTGYDHVTEMRNNLRGLRAALDSIEGSLRNPALAPGPQQQLESARERGHMVLERMRSALAGSR